MRYALLTLMLLTACASNPERGPCGVFLKLDRGLNAGLLGSNSGRTLTSDLAERKSKLCPVLDWVMLPYDVFCAERVLDHCNYWLEYETK